MNNYAISIKTSFRSNVRISSPMVKHLGNYINDLSNSDHLYKGSDNTNFDEFKISRPVYMLAGTFSGSKNEDILDLSGLLTLDLDLKNGESTDIERIINQIKHEAIAHEIKPLIVHKTISGKGLRLIYYSSKVNKDNFKPTLLALISLLERDLEVEFDRSTTNIARGWFACYDPDAYISEDLVEIPDNMLCYEETKIQNLSKHYSYDKNAVESEFKLFTENYLQENCYKGNINNSLYNLGLNVSSFVCSGKHPKDYVSSYITSLINGNDTILDKEKNIKSFHNGLENGIESFDAEKQKKGFDFVKEKKADNIDHFRSANERMKDAEKLPPQKQLMGNLVFENELTIFFADTGVGKSAYIVSWADAITKGKNFLGLKCELENPRIQIIDFELSDQQFFKRYSSLQGPYSFHKNLFIDSIDLPKDNFESDIYSEEVIKSIKESVEIIKPNILVIDNISYISNRNPKESQTACYLLKKFEELRKAYSLSIIVIAHTPKFDTRNPLSLNHLAGSKQFSNLCDAIFALGNSQRYPDKRYIKQLKCRNDREDYKHQVLVCKLHKDGAILTYDFEGIQKERDHLSEGKKDPRLKTVIKLKKEGKSIREIAKLMDLSKSKVQRWIAEIEQDPNQTDLEFTDSPENTDNSSD